MCTGTEQHGRADLLCRVIPQDDQVKASSTGRLSSISGGLIVILEILITFLCRLIFEQTAPQTLSQLFFVEGQPVCKGFSFLENMFR
ncbi:hypothetical protein M758_3G260300 [Ceratodon purpureus]|nr:hypothetical protein M758_3G260300 [Ceratodon purpureus]